MRGHETQRGQPTTPNEDLLRLLFGLRVSQALYVAAELGIADLLASGPRSADDLATASGAHAPSLYRVLRFLASEGVFTETQDGWFGLTPMADTLRRDLPGSLRPSVLFNAGATLWQSWAHLVHTVRTGEPAFGHAHGLDLFEYFRRHPDEWTLFDQPAVAEGARQAIEAAGLADRCEAVGGDFFEAVPAGGDSYLVKNILHDWDDERCVAILRACRRAVPAGGRLLVIELLIPPGDARSFAKSQDLVMLLNSTGRERTVAEYRALYAAAGFALTRTIPAQDEFHVIEGSPA